MVRLHAGFLECHKAWTGASGSRNLLQDERGSGEAATSGWHATGWEWECFPQCTERSGQPQYAAGELGHASESDRLFVGEFVIIPKCVI